MKYNKGFTLIELLVVIAIIGVLASVVLASLSSARNKGADAAIKANLSNVRAQAELVYDSASPNSYATVCADANVAKALASAATAVGGTVAATNAVGTATTVTCNNAAGSWVIGSPLKAGPTATPYWCVDSSGTAKYEASFTAAGATTCA